MARESLREYFSILYFKPKMKIYILNRKVKQKFLIHSLYMPRKIEHEIKTLKKYQEKEINSLKEAVSKGI